MPGFPDIAASLERRTAERFAVGIAMQFFDSRRPAKMREPFEAIIWAREWTFRQKHFAIRFGQVR